MIIPSMRYAGLLGAAILGLAVAPALHAQVQSYFWTGAADNNYLNVANWKVGAVGTSYDAATAATTAPGALADIILTNVPTSRVLNLNYTGTGNYTQQIYGLQSGVNLGYTINLSGTANGTLVYNIVGRGTHPYTTVPTGTSTGNASQRLAFYLNMGPYTVLNFTGATTSPNPGGSTSGLTYAKTTMTGNAYIDASTMTSPKSNTLQLGGLNLGQNANVYLGKFGMTVSALCAAGEEELWAGHIYQDADATEYVNATLTPTGTTLRTQKWGTGITRVTSTGVVDLPAGMALRANGQYLVDGVHNGPITSNNSSGSVIGGTGRINGLVTVGTGTSLAPAGRAAYGTLTINGQVDLNGVLSFELNSPAQYDRLILNGTLNPSATSSLAVGISETFPLQPGVFRVMTFTGITGPFGSVALPSSQGLAASYILGSNYLDIIFTQLAYGANPLLSGNYTIVANVIDQAVVAGKVPGSLLDNLNRQPSINFFKDILEQLMPTCYYGWYPAAVTRANALTQTVSDRLDQQGERIKGVWSPYVSTYRQESSIDASQWADYTNYDTISIMGGADTLTRPGLIAGGFVEYASTHTDLNQLFSSSTTDSFTGGLYGQHRMGALQTQVLGFLGFDKYDSKRNVGRTKLAEWAAGSTSGKRMGISASSYYTQKFPWVEVSPGIGFQVVNWAVDGFTETGAAEASLRVKAQNETDIAGLAGVRFAHTFPTKLGMIRPFVHIGYQRDFGDNTRKIKGETFGTPVTVTVPGIQKTGIRINSGVDWTVASRLTAQVRYTTETGGSSDESVAIHAGVNMTF